MLAIIFKQSFMKKNINKKISDQKFDKKNFLKKALNVLDFCLIKNVENALVDLYCLVVKNFKEYEANILLNNFFKDEQSLLNKLKLSCYTDRTTSFKLLLTLINKGIEIDKEKGEYRNALIDLSYQSYKLEFKDLMTYIFTPTSRLVFINNKTARINNLSHKKSYWNIIPNRGHKIYSCDLSFMNFVNLSKIDSIKYIFSVNKKLYVDSKASINLFDNCFLKEEKEIPYSDVYNVYFLNTISSDFNELKPFLRKIKDESDFEDYYNTEYQWLKVNNYKTKQYSFEDDIIEEGLRKANERFYLLKDKQYTGRFKVFLPTKKLFAFAVNYQPKKPS